MEELDLTGVERVLVVMAHPDDVDFGLAGIGRGDDRRRDRRRVLPGHRRRRGRLGDRHAPRRDGAAAARRAAGRGGDRRRARAALPRLSRRPARSDARAAQRPHPRHPQGAPEPGDDAVARPQLGPHLREPSRPSRGGRGRRCARCIPTPATAGRIPSSRTRASNRGPSTSSGWARAVDGATHYVDITTARRPQDRGAAVAQEPASRSGGDRDDGAKLDERDRADGRACPKDAPRRR